MTKKILANLFAWRIALYAFMFLGIYVVSFLDTYTPYKQLDTRLPYWVDVWANFDGYHYLSIARRGYTADQLPFFPLFPLAIRLLHEVSRLPFIISGQVISTVAFIIAVTFFIKLLALDGNRKIVPLFLAILLLFPTSYYYVAVYNDSLFLLLATLTIYYGRQKRWVAASVWGLFATLTRLNGLALFFFLLAEYIASLNNKKSLYDIKSYFASKIYAVALIPLAFLGFLTYIQLAWGDWNRMFTAMKQWHQDRVIFPLQVVWRYVKILAIHPQPGIIYWVAALELSAVILYTLLIIYSYKKIRLSYWIFFTLSILIPSLTGTFQGMPRYGLHLYPFFLAIALFLNDKPKIVKIMYFAISAILLFLCVTLYTRGYFVA